MLHCSSETFESRFVVDQCYSQPLVLQTKRHNLSFCMSSAVVSDCAMLFRISFQASQPRVRAARKRAYLVLPTKHAHQSSISFSNSDHTKLQLRQSPQRRHDQIKRPKPTNHDGVPPLGNQLGSQPPRFSLWELTAGTARILNTEAKMGCWLKKAWKPGGVWPLVLDHPCHYCLLLYN